VAPKSSRPVIGLWIFLGVVFVGLALYSIASSSFSQPAANSAAAEPAPSESAPAENSDEGDETFRGYACSPDCAELEKGYTDARDKNFKTRDDCPVGGRNSDQYSEGCWAYADEQANQPEQNDQSDQGSP
jgi:hypothetical protein